VFVRIRPKATSGGHADEDDHALRQPLTTTQKKLSGWTDTSIQIADHHGIEDYNFPRKVLPPEISQEEMYLEMLPPFVDRFTAVQDLHLSREEEWYAGDDRQRRGGEDSIDENNTTRGYNVLFFTYGQTGSGKTYSIFGPELHDDDTEPDPRWGIFPRVVHNVLERMEGRAATRKYVLTVSAIEFYLGRCYDLLAGGENDGDGNGNGNAEDSTNGTRTTDSKGKHKYPVLIDGDDFEPRGHVKTRVESMDDLVPVLRRIRDNRAVRATRMNARTEDCKGSSRSHCALILTLFQANYSSRTRYEDRGTYVKTTFTLVDFAGETRV